MSDIKPGALTPKMKFGIALACALLLLAAGLFLVGLIRDSSSLHVYAISTMVIGILVFAVMTQRRLYWRMRRILRTRGDQVASSPQNLPAKQNTSSKETDAFPPSAPSTRSTSTNERKNVRPVSFAEDIVERSSGGLPSFFEVARRNSFFFDWEWYQAQAGVRFANRESALADAREKVVSFNFSPHPLFEQAWFADEMRKRHPKVKASYELLFMPGRAPASPHPLIDLDHVAELFPESLMDPDGIFGWLLKDLAFDELAVLPVDNDASVGKPSWLAYRAEMVTAAKEWRREYRRIKKWNASRKNTFYDWDEDAQYVKGALNSDLPELGLAHRTPVVSIIMPSFNRRHLIGNAIESIQAQSFENWELIIADDGSSDDTVAVAQDYVTKDSRISVIALEHLGVSGARNVAIGSARGEWIAFLDTDNTWVPHFLEVMLKGLISSAYKHGYAALHIEATEDQPALYRTLAGTDALDIGNHIDMNVWMVRRSVLDQVGLFDESIRRTVDYDLIWRVVNEYPAIYLPFVGSNYNDGIDIGERITSTEDYNWKEVVRNNNLIKWDDLGTQVHERQDGVSAVVVWTNERPSQISKTVRSLGAKDSGVDEVIVVGTKPDRFAPFVVTAETFLSDKVAPIHVVPSTPASLLANVGFSKTHYSRVIFARPGATFAAGEVGTMAESLAGHAVVQPLILDDAGVIISAGHYFSRASDSELTVPAGRVYPASWSPDPAFMLPQPLLEGHLAVDAEPLDAIFEADGACLDAMMVVPGPFISLKGFDPMYGARWFDVDYSIRARSLMGLGTVVATRSRVVSAVHRFRGQRAADRSAARLLSRFSEEVSSDTRSPWKGNRFSLIGYDHSRERTDSSYKRLPLPILARSLEFLDRENRNRKLRVAIKHCAPPGAQGEKWGDPYFARQMGRAFAALGHEVLIDNRKSAERHSTYLDDVNIMIRGVTPLQPHPGAINVLWIISRPERVQAEELVGFDLVYAASPQWAARATERFGREVRVLLQATDIHQFSLQGGSHSNPPEALFVGNHRWEYNRPAVEGLLLAKDHVDIGIYGAGWGREGISSPILRGDFVANKDLPTLYRSTKVVLNDHFPTMRDNGFINNRFFDALATGTPVLSDVVPGALEIFGDRVAWYENASEIPEIVGNLVAEPWSLERRIEVSEWIRDNHSFDARAKVVLEQIKSLNKMSSGANHGESVLENSLI